MLKDKIVENQNVFLQTGTAVIIVMVSLAISLKEYLLNFLF